MAFTDFGFRNLIRGHRNPVTDHVSRPGPNVFNPRCCVKIAVKTNKPIHRFRFDGWTHGSWITPFAFVGTPI